MTDIKPTTFKQGVPKAERNGMFGSEEQLIEIAKAGRQVVAIVTYAVPKVIRDEIADERYPLAEIVQIEPLFDEAKAAAAIKLRDEAYTERTGQDALVLPDVDE